MKAEDRKKLQEWKAFVENTKRATPIDLNETVVAKQKRIANLEKNPEAWFKYYFPNYYTSEPMPFHKAATRRVLKNLEWYEVRSWSRELAKSARTMMEVLYLVLTEQKSNVLMVSNTLDNAERLLLPYKVQLEANQRIINDYGQQEQLGTWESSEFKTKKGKSFRALGAGQSPRGTRNDAARPDVILIDDIDTDEECRNPDRIKEKVKWINEALYATRSVSGHLLWIACGNIISKFCCITEMAKHADKHDIINIRDKNGKSTWATKNTEDLIDRVLSKIPWSAAQKEYFNNPISEGDVFKEIKYERMPLLKRCEQVVVYADPSTSNKDRGVSKQTSFKSVVIVGSIGRKRYLYKCFVEQTSNAKFVDWLYEAWLYCKEKGVDTFRLWIENNSLQDPFYRQAILPLIYSRSNHYGFTIPVSDDDRKKPDKFFRIEATLEPLNRNGNLSFNIAEKEDPHMVRMHDQMIGVSAQAKIMDAPDALEGACWLIQNNTYSNTMSYAVGIRPSRKY